jgi:hypothetical protein
MSFKKGEAALQAAVERYVWRDTEIRVRQLIMTKPM